MFRLLFQKMEILKINMLKFSRNLVLIFKKIYLKNLIMRKYSKLYVNNTIVELSKNILSSLNAVDRGKDRNAEFKFAL